MGKSKKGKTPPAAASAAKCVCDHPFNCFCGNRPERPSRGHKWDPDTQQWGGKGHKQKGGSGQTGDVAQQAKTTQVGQTQVSQWQKLPSALLKEFCQKQKRPPPKFKEILNDNSKQKFKVRCIVPDAKDSDKDLILFPTHPVGNEEQAKEEAALLALMHVTPNLPHERKLPEPYRTTWLNALQAQREQAKHTKPSNSNGANNNSTHNNNNNGANNKPSSANNAHTTTSTTNSNSNSKANSGASSSSSRAGGASASTNLTMATRHVSAADRRKQRDAKTKERNTRLRRHEAIRMANRDHPVFMSANLRQQITRLLQGDDPQTIFLENPADDETAAAELETFESDRQAYVEERLHVEGFTKRQARTAFQNLSSKFKGDEDDEDLWEGLYDECLQWLCVHLTEDQLPEGFDPREQTLEVVAHGNKTNKTSSSNDALESSKKEVLSAEAQQLASIYGLSDDDAVWLLWNAAQKDDGSSVEETLWKKVSELANLAGPNSTSAISQSADDYSHQVVQDEMEALEAMFPEDCQLTTQQDGLSTISIQTSEELSLSIVFASGAYPSVLPQRVVCSGKWPQRLLGVAFHVELAKFLSTLALGEPMVFELYGQMQLLLQTLEELPEMSLSRKMLPPSVAASQTNAKQPNNKSKKPQSARPKLMLKRPRARGVFWSMHPTKVPPAVAFPRLSKSLELQRKGLPAGKARQEFLSILKEADKSSRVVLVTGDTGCGKTTQIPQFILEEAPVGSKIVVAQPRRLAATGVAARVADERGEDKPGKGSVGYVVRGDSAICKNTRLLFCTFGILLRQLQCDGALDNITHIVIDEVHERNLDGDVLMALLKQCLDSTPNLRVILMSATLDADRFAAYWGKNTPRLHIPGRTFPVEDYMLEDILTMTGYIPPKKGKKKYFGFGNNEQRPRKSTPWNDSEKSDNEEEEEEEESQETSSGAKSTQPHGNMPPLEERLKRVDESHIDYDMLGQLVKHLVREKVMGVDGSILVFLPGAGEINQAKTAIGKITGGLPIMLLPLHGGLQPREQNIVFQPSPNAVKVILSTNVAETSITIPDCTVVIDTCREKQSSYDPVNRMPLLIEVFASRSSLKQRRGRAGRVREGKCYKLISKSTHAKLHEHTAPEITRCALDQTLLSLLFLGVERGNGAFLRTLLDPPSQKSVDAATFSLWKIGALERVEGNELRLTPLGMHLAGIPAPPVVGKMLVMGSILGCRRASLAMAAGISTGRSPFLRVDTPRFKQKGEESIEDMKKRLVLEERGKLFEESGNSDHAMLAAAFIGWECLSPGGGERKRYCEKLGLSFTGMRDILQLVNQYDSALNAAGYGKSAESDRNAKSFRVLRTCAISAMAPSQLVRIQRPSTKYAETAEGAREKDGLAKELKFFIRNDEETTTEQPGNGRKEERVFIHPSSSLFSVGNYGCPWLVYNSMVKTSKPFLRDATECSAYALLLFGGNLEVEARNSVIVIDGRVKLSANARIGALIRGLRGKMDDLLAQKIKDPTIDISDTPEMKLIVNLLFTDGLGG